MSNSELADRRPEHDGVPGDDAHRLYPRVPAYGLAERGVRPEGLSHGGLYREAFGRL